MARKSKGTLYKRGKQGVFYLEYYVNGKRVRRRLLDEDGNPITTRREAEQAKERELAPLKTNDETERRRQVANAYRDAAQVAEDVEEKTREKLSLQDSWDAYLKSQNRPDSSDATLRQYSFQWDKFLRFLEGQYPDAVNLVDVTSDIAHQYVQHLSENLSPGTVNKHVRLCRLVFSTLAEREPIHENPFDGIKPKRDVQQTRKELSWDKLCEICDKATGELKTLIFLGLYTGQRLADCCLLTWDQVDLMRNVMLITPQKTRRRNGGSLQIPIHPQLRPMLEQTPQDKRQGYVLPELAQHYNANRDRVTDRIQTLFRNCGIQVHAPGTGEQYDPESGKWYHTGKRAVLQYGFHSLRHSTVTLLQEAGTPQAVVQELVGHRSPAMTQRYTHVGEKALQGAVNGIRAIGNGNGDDDAEDETEKLRKQATELIQDATKEQLQNVMNCFGE